MFPYYITLGFVRKKTAHRDFSGLSNEVLAIGNSAVCRQPSGPQTAKQQAGASHVTAGAIRSGRAALVG